MDKLLIAHFTDQSLGVFRLDLITTQGTVINQYGLVGLINALFDNPCDYRLWGSERKQDKDIDSIWLFVSPELYNYGLGYCLLPLSS